MNSNEFLANKKELANSQDILKDLVNGDPYALKKFEEMDLDMDAIKTALNFITNNDYISQKDKAQLLQESWRINFRSKPPTPEEFLSEKYLGYTAVSLYPRIKKAFLDFLDPNSKYRNLILYPHIGWGKALWNKSKVYTPSGYRLIEDITIGDEVITPNGSIAHVQNKQEYPDDPIYRITFGDERIVYAAGNHYWKAARNYDNSYWDKQQKKYVLYPKTEPKRPSWKIITTEEILKDMGAHPGQNRGWFIPLTKPAQHVEKNHLIPPYTLGALLGDGYADRGSHICGDDYYVFERVLEESTDPRYTAALKDFTKAEDSVNYKVFFKKGEGSGRNQFKQELSRLNLLGTRSASKFIPDEYKYDSVENRISLLQGLMDTDGSVECKGSYPRASYYTKSERLKDDFVELCSGLGAARCVVTQGKDSVYRITITFPDNSFPIFGLERKQKYIDAEYAKDKSGHKKQRKPRVLHIKSIERTELKGASCIETDDDERLFLTENYIVTHNSFLSTLITLYLDTCVSLMRRPAKYFGLSQATSFSSMLVSYSLKKSSELLVAPFLNILESSPFFEKVTRREAMQELSTEYILSDKPVEKLYYTTAAKDKASVLEFDSGLSVKVASNPRALTGLTLISVALSELAFFVDAGKALALDEPIQVKDGIKLMRDIQVGDYVLSPSGEYTEVVNIPWEGRDDLYEIVVEGGRTVRCNRNHLWPVVYTDKKGSHETVVSTGFMLDRPLSSFMIQAYKESSRVKITSIKKVGENIPQKCIRVKNLDGLFVLGNGLITHNSSDFIMRLWNDSVSRVESRMHGNYYGRSILDSSPNSLTSAIDQWIVYESWKSPLNYIIKGSMWEWNPEEYAKEFQNHETFKIYTGGKGQPPRILEENDPLLESPETDLTKIIDVPNSQKQFFIDDLNKSLKDRAGIPTGAADSIITDYSIIEDMFNNNLRNIYLNITAPANESPKELIWNQIKSTFFKNRMGKYEFYYLPHIARCVSVDQSEVSDITSISMAHVERYQDTGDTYYVVDFTITIVPDSNRINLAAIEEFIKDLRSLGNLNIAKVSFDSFQSAVTIQNLKRAGFEVEKLSVDKTTGPYLNLVSLMNRRRISVGKNIFLKNNLKCLHMSSSKKSDHIKIDHDSSRTQVTIGDSDWNTSFIGYYGKDVSDSVAAVIELCSKEFPVAQVNWNPDSIPSENRSREEDYNSTRDKVLQFIKTSGFKI